MKIDRVELQGWKGGDRAVDLTGLDIVLGPVGAGKSAILDGLRFAALGHVPSIGARPSATGQLLAASLGRVEIGLSDGSCFERCCTRRGKSFHLDAKASWVDDVLPTVHGEAIRDLFGASNEEAIEHLDLRPLLTATPRRRVERLEGLLAAGDGERIAGDVRLLLAVRSQHPTGKVPESLIQIALELEGERREALASESFDKLPKLQREAVHVVASRLASLCVQHDLAAATAEAREQKNAATAECRANVEARAALEAAIAESGAGDIGDKEIEAAEQAYDEARTALDVRRRERDSRARVLQARTLAERDVVECERELGDAIAAPEPEAQPQPQEDGPWREVHRRATAMGNLARPFADKGHANAARIIAHAHRLRALADEHADEAPPVAMSADSRAKSIEALEAALRTAKARLDGITDVAPVEAGGEAIEDLEAAVQAAREAAQRCREIARLRSMIAESVAKVERLDAVRDAWALGLWACEQAKDLAVTSAASAGLVTHVGDFLVAAGWDDCDPYLAERGSFGWVRDSLEVPVETMSGGETVMFTAAVAHAIVAQRAPKIRCLLIEAAELGPSTGSLLVALSKMREHTDNVIVATNQDLGLLVETDDERRAVKLFNVIEV